jgi:hypothetical protein
MQGPNTTIIQGKTDIQRPITEKNQIIFIKVKKPQTF